MGETLGGSVTQSILGTRSTVFMTKLTAVCATFFRITCLSLAYLSAQKRVSLFRDYQPAPAAPAPVETAPEPAAVTEPTEPEPPQGP